MQESPPWWESAFDADYLEVYGHRDDRQAENEIAALLPRLAAAPGPILDACCGHGRHLEALLAAGVPAVGFDLSPALLAAAAKRRRCAGHLVQCDMRSPPFAGGSFGAVILLFTAFGYFDEAGNRACLGGLGDLLAPDGWLLIDLPDPDHLRRTLVPESRRITGGGLEIDESRRLVGNRIEKEVVLRRQGGAARRYTESVRLYGRDELRAMAATAGLALVEVWPSLRGPASDGHRLVCWFRR